MATANPTAVKDDAHLRIIENRAVKLDLDGYPRDVLRDRRGYPRAKANLPGYHTGRPSATKGRKYPPDPPTTEELVKFIQTIKDTRSGRRHRALTILLWRTGLRISEALALEETDLDEKAGSIVVRRGKGGKRRVVGMDPWGWQQIRPWIREREEYPAGKLFPVIAGPTAGWRSWNRSDVNKEFRLVQAEANIRRRMAPHQLRHKFSVEWVLEGVPMPLLMRQLGHANLQVTTIYVSSLNVDDILDVSRKRDAPVMPLPDFTALAV